MTKPTDENKMKIILPDSQIKNDVHDIIKIVEGYLISYYGQDAVKRKDHQPALQNLFTRRGEKGFYRAHNLLDALGSFLEQEHIDNMSPETSVKLLTLVTEKSDFGLLDNLLVAHIWKNKEKFFSAEVIGHMNDLTATVKKVQMNRLYSTSLYVFFTHTENRFNHYTLGQLISLGIKIASGSREQGIWSGKYYLGKIPSYEF